MKTAKEILAETRNQFASVLTENHPLCDVEDSALDTLAMEAGFASIKQVENEWNVWSRPVADLAKDLIACAAQMRAEKAGIGRWDSLEEFLTETESTLPLA